MRTAGIICEYNPFHNGHAYQIAATRKAGCTHVVALMSGNFTQRGEPALLESGLRCRAALAGGADLVVQLPLPWAVSSAERFARAGVFLLHAMGCVDVLSFGSECGNLPALFDCVKSLDEMDEGLLRERLRAGESFAAAREQAAAVRGACALPHSPNDILAVEYLRAVARIGPDMRPLAVPRRGAAHDGPEIGGGPFASASALRETVRREGALPLAKFVPSGVQTIYEQVFWEGRMPFDSVRFEDQMLSYLRRLRADDFLWLPDVSEGLENRIAGALRTAESVGRLLSAVKTRRYALSRIRRILLYAFLGITREVQSQRPPYLRVLGFNERGEELLRRMKTSATLPVVVRFSQMKGLSLFAREVFELESKACDLYSLCLPVPGACGLEKSRRVLRPGSDQN